MKSEHIFKGRRSGPPQVRSPNSHTATSGVRPADKWLISATPGLLPFVEAECRRLGFTVKAPQGEELYVQTTAPDRFLKLRAAHAVYYPVQLPISRPQGILSCEHHLLLQAAFAKVFALQKSQKFTGLRLEGAGNDSTTFQRIGSLFSQFTNVPVDQENGDLVVRIRPHPSAQAWQVLIRATPRPLATRAWRAVDYQGAVSGPLAAALVALSKPSRDDTVLNLACGSSTILIERLIAAPATAAIGIDISPDAIDASKANIAAASKLHPRAALSSLELLTGSFTEVPLPNESCSVIFCDPPWGELNRSHRGIEKQYDGLVKEAKRLLKPGGRFCVLTQRPEFILNACAGALTVEQSLKVSQGGFTPTLLLLQKGSAAH